MKNNDPRTLLKDMEGLDIPTWLFPVFGAKDSLLLALYLNQSSKSLSEYPEDEGWFVYTHAQAMRDWGFQLGAIRRAKKRFLKMGILKSRMGLDIEGQWREWLKIDYFRLREVYKTYKDKGKVDRPFAIQPGLKNWPHLRVISKDESPPHD